MSNKILLLLAHPSYEDSRINRVMIDAVSDLGGVSVHDLYEVYPHFHVDAAREQQLVVAHDAIVMQYPFYWYSVPALLKEWLDVVLCAGFAHGEGGIALRDKPFMSAITTTASARAFGDTRRDRFSVTELLRPVEQIARQCRARWLPPFVVYSAKTIDQDAMARHGDDYRRVLTAIRDERLPQTFSAMDSVNRDLGWIAA